MGWHDLQRDLKKSHLQHLPPCLHPQTCWVPSTDSLILLCVGGVFLLLWLNLVATALMRDVFVARMCEEMSFVFCVFNQIIDGNDFGGSACAAHWKWLI